MAMMSELFAAFDDLKSIVEKVSESLEKGSDGVSALVSVCTFRSTLEIRGRAQREGAQRLRLTAETI